MLNILIDYIIIKLFFIYLKLAYVSEVEAVMLRYCATAIVGRSQGAA